MNNTPITLFIVVSSNAIVSCAECGAGRSRGVFDFVPKPIATELIALSGKFL